MTDRLTRSDWIKHGFRALSRQGPEALKAEPLAAALNVSRGSFYWHFKGVADFHAQLLGEWQASATDLVITRLEEDSGPDRLKLLLRRAFKSGFKLERAIRTWAASNRKVAAAVAATDEKRIAYIADLLVMAGIDRRRASARSQFLYWAFLGHVMNPAQTALSVAMLDEISHLFEAG